MIKGTAAEPSLLGWKALQNVCLRTPIPRGSAFKGRTGAGDQASGYRKVWTLSRKKPFLGAMT